MKTQNPIEFRIEETSMKGHVLLQYDDPRNSGLPCRSIQMEEFVAAYIVKCVNNHEKLAKALRHLLFCFDRELKPGMWGRAVCDEAIKALLESED